jgi:hypothetical protein
MAGSIYVPILSSFNPSGVNNARKSLGGLAGAFDGVKRALGLASAGFVAFRAVSETIDFGRSSIVAARDLERNLNALDSVFGELAPRMEQFAQNGVDIGLSQIDAAKSSTFLGSVLKQAGFEMEDVASQTESLVGLASDLATTYGYDVSEALSGMTALFRGEYDPIEKFGVAMKQSEVNAVLAANGQGKLDGAARRTAEQMARLALLYQRTQDAQGAFKEGTGTLFVEQQRLQAIFANLQSEVGKALIPALVSVAETLQPLVKTLAPAILFLFTQFADIINILAGELSNTQSNLYNFVQVMGGLFAVLKLVLPFLLDNALAIGGLIAVYKAVNGAVALAAATTLAYSNITAAATATTVAAAAATTASTASTVAATGATVAATAATTAATGATAGLATVLRATPWGALATGAVAIAAVGYTITDAMHKAYMEIEGVKEATDALGKGATIGGPNVGLGRAMQGGAYANRRNFENIVPMYKRAPIALNYNTEAVDEVEKAQTEFQKKLEDLLKNFTGAVETTNSGTKKIAAATEKVIDTQADALKKEEEALADFKKSLSELVPALRPLAVATREIGEFEQSTIDSFRNIVDKVDEAFREGIITQGAQREFAAYLAVEKTAFMAINRQRDELVKKRGLAETLISDIKAAIIGVGSLAGLLETETRQVTTATTKIVDGFTITTKRTVDEIVGGQGVLSKLSAVVAKTKAFAGQLTQLRRLGLNENLFKQIVEAGPDVGGQLAVEILAGGSDAVGALNTTFKELEDVAGQISEQTAQVMYGSGVDVSKGLINGLLAQEQALVSAAETLANAFVKAFNELMAKLQVPSLSNAGGTNAAGFAYTTDPMLGGTAESQFGSGTPWAQAVASFRASQAPTVNNYNITYKAGVITNGKAAGQEVTALVNQYTKSSGL